MARGPSVEACARCDTEKASLTKMSPSLASWLTKAGSFFSSPGWKRVFSRQRMSPFFMAATACSAVSPMQSSTNFTGRLMTCATSAATGLSEFFGSRPFGRPKCDSRITLRALVGDFGDGVRHAFDAGAVADHAVLDRHIEVGAHEHALALHVGVVEGAERAHGGPGTRGVRSACPSRRRCPPCGWRSPIRCRTTTSRAPACRPSPWSGPCGRSTNADRG